MTRRAGEMEEYMGTLAGDEYSYPTPWIGDDVTVGSTRGDIGVDGAGMKGGEETRRGPGDVLGDEASGFGVWGC